MQTSTTAAPPVIVLNCNGWEDTEWCARVREVGWYLLIAGRSLLLHRSYGSDVNFNALYYLHRNR